jgi:hypothetical protein
LDSLLHHLFIHSSTDSLLGTPLLFIHSFIHSSIHPSIHLSSPLLLSLKLKLLF